MDVDPQPDPSDLTILTYNVNFGLARKTRTGKIRLSPRVENVIEAIKQSSAEVVSLQETNQAWESAFNDAGMKELYPNQRWFHRGAAGGAALLCASTCDLLSCEMVDTPSSVNDSWFEQLVAQIKVLRTNMKIDIVGVHLRPPKGMMFWTSPTRKAELEFVFKSLKEKGKEEDNPLIVLGDFNEETGYSALNFLRDQELNDALEEHVPKQKETIHVDVPMLFGLFYWHRTFRIDHICYSHSHFESIACEVLPGYEQNASDHQPVFAVLKMK